MDINLQFPKRENFNVPPGIWTAQLKQVFVTEQPYKDQTEKSLKLKFRILDLEHPTDEYVVSRRYPYSLAVHSELRKHLESWLGPEGLASLVVNGGITLNKLIGEYADIETTEIENDGYRNPFVHLLEIAPKGRLKRRRRREDEELVDQVTSPAMQNVAELLKR
jgi:hypothetical protein